MPTPDDYDYTRIPQQRREAEDRAPYVGHPGYGDIMNSTGMFTGMENMLVGLIEEHEALLDFIEMGINAVDTLQPEAFNMRPEYLKATFGGRLAFHGCISTSEPLTHGTTEEVYEYCRRTLEIMMPGGGYWFSPTHQIQDNTPTENVLAMYLRGGSTPFSSPCLASPAREILQSILAAPGHQFWADELSLADTRRFPASPAAKHLTDFYLLALAARHGGRLATFDPGIDATLLPEGSAAYHLIPTA